MAIFFDHQVQAPDTGGNVDISWHDVEPLLAVASRNDGGGGFVQLYNEEVNSGNVFKSFAELTLL